MECNVPGPKSQVFLHPFWLKFLQGLVPAMECTMPGPNSQVSLHPLWIKFLQGLVPGFASDCQKMYQMRFTEMKWHAIPGNKLGPAIDQNLALRREVKFAVAIVDW